MIDGENTRFQLAPTFQNGWSLRDANCNGKTSLSRASSYVANEYRAKNLSLSEAFQSKRASPWCARILSSVSPT